MTMYLSNADIRPTGYEPAEFIEPPTNVAAPEGVAVVNDPRANQPDDQLAFLQVLLEENASIAGDVLQVGDNLWVIHGFIAVDGDVLMAEFDSYDQAAYTLDRLPQRELPRDGL